MSVSTGDVSLHHGTRGRLTRRRLARGAAAVGVIGAAVGAGCGPMGAAQSQEKVKVQFLEGWGAGPWREAGLFTRWQSGIAAKHPNIDVEFLLLPPGEAWAAKLLSMVSAGTPPDASGSVPTDWAYTGQVRNLEPYFRRDKEVSGWQWNPPSLQVVSIVVEGKPFIWAMPGNPDARQLFVNLDLLAKEGIPFTPDQPWTWDEFQERAKRLTKRRSDGSFEQVGANAFGTGMTELHLFTTAAGGDFFEIDPKTKLPSRATFNAPKTQQAIEYFNQLAVKDRVGLLPTDNSQGLTFAAGNVAIQPNWSGTSAALNRTPPGFKWDVMGYPVVKKGDRWPHEFGNGSWLGAMLSTTKAPDAVFNVLKYVAGPEGTLVRMDAMGIPPAHVNHKEGWETWLKTPPANKVVFQKVMAAGKVGPWALIQKNSAEINKVYSDELKRMLAGEIGTKQFADTVTEQSNRLLGAT